MTDLHAGAEIADPILAEIHAAYPAMVDGVMEAGQGDIDSTFLGFLDTYKALAPIIPLGRTVIDLGCCYAFQSWFFRNHKYIGIDVMPVSHRIRLPNHQHLRTSIKSFCEDDRVDRGPTFAICNYVPPWHGGSFEHVLKRFTDLFIFYPQSGDHPEDEARVKAAMRKALANTGMRGEGGE